ncbi:pilus assembly protein PilM [Candidatus Saganbacteria bacterium]|nr:pilus assembly protein PilM [Candidatus Saganbacteria bacterium]
MIEKSILGIDLRAPFVKVVELKNTTSGFILSSWAIDELQNDLIDKHPDMEAAQGASIKKIITEKSIKTKEAYFVIGGRDVLVKKLSMPKLSHEEIKQAIIWKVKDEIVFNAEESIVDYSPLALKPGSEEQEVIAAIVNRETIKRIGEIALSANLKLASIVPVPVALRSLCMGELAKTPVLFIMYMGRRTMNMSFFKGSELLINREVSIGGEDITHAMTSVLVSDEGRSELKYEEAEKIKREHGIPVNIEAYPAIPQITSANIYSLMRPALERMQDEISRTIEYFKGQEGDITINKILVVGGESKTPNIREFLSGVLGLPVEFFDPLSEVKAADGVNDGEKLKEISPRLACAIGAAMASAEKNINLAPQIEDKWKSMLRKHANPIKVFTILFLILFTYYSGMVFVSYNLSNSINKAEKILADIKPRLLRIEALEKAMKEEEGRRGIFKSIELSRVKIPVVLEAISANIPESILIDSITFMEADRKTTIRGVSLGRGDSAENIISKFVSKLSENTVFESLQLVSVIRADEYLYDAFNFEVIGVIRK